MQKRQKQVACESSEKQTEMVSVVVWFACVHSAEQDASTEAEITHERSLTSRMTSDGDAHVLHMVHHQLHTTCCPTH